MFWPLTALAAARLAAPFIVIVLSCIFLREYATRTQLFFLFSTLSGAVLIVAAQPEGAADEERIATLGAASFAAYLYLFGEPFGMAVGQVLMRKLKNLSNMTISCYTKLFSHVKCY